MEENIQNVFTGKTVEDAIAEGLKTLGLTAEQAEITVLEEGRKKLIGSVKAKVKITKKSGDGERAANFIDGLLKILKINAFSEIESDGEKIEIDIKTTNTAAVIGRRGEVLDAIQCIAGAVANIGREEYRRVVVDCENYRAAREEKLKALAASKAAKAVERKRRIALEPMSPYERRVVHSSLSSNSEVTTLSEGNEPLRRVIIIPKNEIPYERREKIDRRGQSRDRNFVRRGGKSFNDRKSGGRSAQDRKSAQRNSAPRAKKQIYFGTYLGNSGAGKEEDKKED